MKWEYKILYYQNGRDPQYQGWNIDDQIVEEFRDQSLQIILNTLGKNGWELISVLKNEEDSDPHFYFKRML
jgi:hypothetical protein